MQIKNAGQFRGTMIAMNSPLRRDALNALRNALQEAHWAARDLADRHPGLDLREVMDRLHASRKLVESLHAQELRLAA